MDKIRKKIIYKLGGIPAEEIRVQQDVHYTSSSDTTVEVGETHAHRGGEGK